MNDLELQMGDLVYFLATNGVPEHIALYVNHKDGIPYVIHATGHPYNAVMLTRLSSPDDNCNYRVVRPLNKNLAYVATGILFRWVESQIPFATTEKRDAICNYLDDIGGWLDNADLSAIGRIQESYGQETYVSNYSQYVSMLEALPMIPEEHDRIQGLRCSEAIVAAFNIALLIMHETCKKTLSGYKLDPDPCINLESFIGLLDNPLPFDAKKMVSAGMLKYCSEHPAQWSDLGVLNIQPKILNKEEADSNRSRWLGFRDALRLEAPDKIAPLIASPGSSPRTVNFNGCDSPLSFLQCSSFDSSLLQRPSSPMKFLSLSDEVVAVGTTGP